MRDEASCKEEARDPLDDETAFPFVDEHLRRIQPFDLGWVWGKGLGVLFCEGRESSAPRLLAASRA